MKSKTENTSDLIVDYYEERLQGQTVLPHAATQLNVSELLRSGELELRNEVEHKNTTVAWYVDPREFEDEDDEERMPILVVDDEIAVEIDSYDVQRLDSYTLTSYADLVSYAQRLLPEVIEISDCCGNDDENADCTFGPYVVVVDSVVWGVGYTDCEALADARRELSDYLLIDGELYTEKNDGSLEYEGEYDVKRATEALLDQFVHGGGETSYGELDDVLCTDAEYEAATAAADAEYWYDWSLQYVAVSDEKIIGVGP